MSLALENIALKYGKQTYLQDINLCFEPGAFNVLLGRTLAGKTSLLRTIAGLEKAATGRVILQGKDISSTPVQERQLSMVYQQFINYPHLSVFENIASPLTLSGVSSNEVKKRVQDIAELLSIGEFLTKYPLELSGGQQQRCAMARALVKDSQIILFDEPLVNLDYKLRESLRRELRSLFKQRDSIAIYATTEAHEALALGGNTVLLHEGRVLQSGNALTQFYRPSNLHAADLYHEPPLNRFNCNIKNGIATNMHIPLREVAHLQNLPDGEYIFAYRPDKLKLARENASSEQHIVFDATVELTEISASESYVHLRVLQNETEAHSWVMCLSGIYQFEAASKLQVCVLLKDIFVFDEDGNSVSWPQFEQLINKEAG